ncbi:MAG TPA: FeS-binding protein [Deltaproteobacteria bacterium]|jgi:nitrite reductase/ring-hydroxylating ferredoxin subunit|nr:FeS-binding protein [Deltaproteobacteria bacterium]
MSRRERHHTELPIPNGWFAVAFSNELVPGEVRRLHYFDEDLVLYRGRDGTPRVLDAYCPHLGAHLAEGGRVVGDTIRCPFHGWRFDGTGLCVEIPYCERIPPKARVRGWDVVEKNRMIFVWHHAEGKPPSWDFPAMPELDHPDWTEPRSLELKVAVHMQDMHENNNDPVHFQFVHANAEIPPSEITFGEGGRYMRMVGKSQRVTPFGTFETLLERDSWGLGLSAVRIAGIPGAGLLMYSSTTPVDRGHSHSRWLFTVTKNLVDLAGEQFIQDLSAGVKQDLRIWENKVHRARPVLCEADRYLADFRQWARQFYSEPA